MGNDGHVVTHCSFGKMTPQQERSIVKDIFSRRMIVSLLMGFSCGLPLLLTISVLQAWMAEEGVDLTLIGMMALVGLPYTLKFLWAPVSSPGTTRVIAKSGPPTSFQLVISPENICRSCPRLKFLTGAALLVMIASGSLQKGVSISP